MHILISPNAFKNSLPAEEVALAIQEGIHLSRLECSTECFPVGDGGDGTADLLIKKCKGEIFPTEVQDALGRKINTYFGLIDNGTTAVIEMANAAGLRLLAPNELDPLIATSYGTGEQIRMALDRGVQKIIVCMGGSATIDGGVGIMEALGVRFLEANKKQLSRMPGTLMDLASIDLSGLDVRVHQVEFAILCDVDNPLLGKNGAASVFGPQKGASPSAIEQLDKGLTKLAAVSFAVTRKDMARMKYGGTAGGAAAGLATVLGAKLENGIDYLLDLTGFNTALDNADLVITGEGSIDEQTLQGKGPFGVASRARGKRVPVIGIAGRVPLTNSALLNEWFDILLPISHEPMDITSALHHSRDNLVRSGNIIGNFLALKGRSQNEKHRIATQPLNLIR